MYCKNHDSHGLRSALHLISASVPLFKVLFYVVLQGYEHEKKKHEKEREEEREEQQGQYGERQQPEFGQPQYGQERDEGRRENEEVGPMRWRC